MRVWRIDADEEDRLLQTCYIDLAERVELHMFGSHVP